MAMCGLTTDGDVYCWSDTSPAEQVPMPLASSIGVGDDHACAVLTTGNISCWGSNDVGQAPAHWIPTAEVESLHLGYQYSCALQTDGTLECIGDLPADVTPVFDAPITALAAGYRHLCAVVSETLICWGSPHNGRLGRGTEQQETAKLVILGG